MATDDDRWYFTGDVTIPGQRRRVTRALVFIVVSSVLAGMAAAACADLSGLTGGGPPSLDGSVPPVDGRVDAGSSPDGRSDGRMDAAARPDVDAVAEATEAACPGYPDAIFCDDFDKGPFGARWTAESALFGSVSQSDAQAYSTPFSLFAEIYDGGTTTEGQASLNIDFPEALSRVRNSYDVYFVELGERSAAIGSIYHLAAMNTYFGVYLFAHGGPTMEVVQEGSLSDGGAEFLHTDFPSIPLATWTRVILDVDFSALTFTLSLETPPGAPAVVAVPATTLAPTITGTSTMIVGGIDYVAFPETRGWQVYVDNVVVEAP